MLIYSQCRKNNNLRQKVRDGIFLTWKKKNSSATSYVCKLYYIKVDRVSGWKYKTNEGDEENRE